MCQVEWRKIEVKMVAWIADKRCNSDTWTRQTKGKTKRDKVRTLSFPVAYFSWAFLQETAEAIYKQHKTPSFATFQLTCRCTNYKQFIDSNHSRVEYEAFISPEDLSWPRHCCLVLLQNSIKENEKKLNAVHRIQFSQVLSVSTMILHAELQLNFFLEINK